MSCHFQSLDHRLILDFLQSFQHQEAPTGTLRPGSLRSGGNNLAKMSIYNQCILLKLLGQLRLSCEEEKQFRALNLDISCPDHLPLSTSCKCVTRSKTGGVVSKENGTISTYHVSQSSI